MPAFIDSRFPRDATATMQRAVADAQERRRTIMGPPAPAAPIDMSEGVEVKGRRLLTDQLNQGPPSPTMQNMVVNGGRPYAPRLPGTDIGGPPDATAPVQAPPALPGASAPRLAPRMPGTEIGEPRNPLGGMPTTPLSSRGGPMNYSQQGVGTNNPNAYAVGRNNKGSGERLLRRMARSGGEGGALAAKTLFEAQRDDKLAPDLRRWEMQKESQVGAREDLKYQRERSDKMTDTAETRAFELFKANQGIAQKQAEQEQERLWSKEDYERERNDQLTDEQRKAEQARQTFPLIDPVTGKTHEGNFMTGNGMMATRSGQREAPDLSKWTNDPNNNLRIKSVDSTGKATWERVDDKGTGPRPFTGKIQSEGGEEVTDPKTGQKSKTPVRQFTVMEDPATGKLVKRYVEDADGNGVPDNKEQSAPSWLDWLNTQSK